ncbi:ABC transporter substrate-binding protein [Dehalogenimonas sp. THU2]|uniref:ABC transporter substrate-binding protein n=1 Tax=Dehalogenimonas sp. THU2 TaxID=3151121 RepID=UPI003218C15C
MKLTRRTFVTWLLAVAAIIFIFKDRFDIGAGTKILVLANRSDPPSNFNSMRTSSIALHHVAGALFGAGNLVMRNRGNMYLPSPYLARRWYSNPDFTEWTFILERNVLWHDGTLFTPEDVKFWLDLAVFGAKVGDKVRAPAYYKGALDIEKVEVIPTDQVKITLQNPNRFFPDVLADPRIKIDHPRHLMESRINAGEINLSPLDVGLVGLGPFEFDSYEPGSIIRVRRFGRYFESDAEGKKLPYLDGIDYIITSEALSMDIAFRTGRLDGTARGFGHYLTEQRMDNYVKDFGDDINFAKMDGGTFRLAFNVLKPGPWQDARVRRAIALWIDKKAAIPIVLDGFGWTTPEISPDNPFRDKNFVVWTRFDTGPLEERRSEARRLLTEAGYAGGFTMGYLCRAQNGIPGGQFLKDQLAGLGIDLQLRIVEEGEWNRGRVSLDYDSQSGNLSVLATPEGTEGVYGRFSKSPDAYSKHEDAEIDRFYTIMKDATTYDRRVDVWYQLQKYLFMDQTYVIPIAEITYVQAFRTWVKGLAIPPEDGHTFTDYSTVWLDRGAD